MKYVIGLDYGSDSARAVVVNAETGQTLATSVKNYPRWSEGKYCDPAANRYRQHPQDYIDVLEATVKDALSQCPAGTAEQVVGIAFDTTGSTPVFTDRTGTPLAMLPEFAENPNAMFVLWKDHTAVKEAAEINELSHKWNPDYTAYEGGIYSSEWYWAKALHVLREDEQVRKAARSLPGDQAKIVVFGNSRENYGTDLMGLAIWISYERKGQAMSYLTYALDRWNEVKAGQKKTRGKAIPFTNEYDATVQSTDFPIHYAYLQKLNPPVPASREMDVTSYCYDAGSVNMYQAVQLTRYYNLSGLPALIADGRALPASSSASAIVDALR